MLYKYEIVLLGIGVPPLRLIYLTWLSLVVVVSLILDMNYRSGGGLVL